MSRYEQLAAIVDLIKPRSIVEIGTNEGRSAVLMIKQAQKYRNNVQYVGYDLFEEANSETDASELNIKRHPKVDQVQAAIVAHCPGVDINLIKGNTRQTLCPLMADVVFVDGGHSIETIAGDFDKVRHSSVIILDDFYTPDEDGKCPDINLYGCNKLVESLPSVVLLPMKNKVKTGGWTQMAMVIGERLV